MRRDVEACLQGHTHILRYDSWLIDARIGEEGGSPWPVRLLGLLREARGASNRAGWKERGESMKPVAIWNIMLPPNDPIWDSRNGGRDRPIDLRLCRPVED
jgi:hypothetical protein